MFPITANDSMMKKWQAYLIFDKITSVLFTSVTNTEKFFLVWVLRVNMVLTSNVFLLRVAHSLCPI